MRRLSALLPAALLCASLPCPRATAQMLSATFDATTAASYEQEAGRLRRAEPQQYDFSKAMLGDVLRFLATDAGISFFSLPDDSPDGSRLITFSIKASPFQVLETLCKANGLAIIPDNSIWYIRPADDKELIGKSYLIKHNSLERVERAGSGTMGSSPASGGSGGSGVDIQGNQETFSVRRSELINAIRSLLGLPPEETEMGQQATQGTTGAAAGAVAGQSEDIAKAMNSNELSSFRKPKVIWQSDSNTLYIVATRLQHLWVEGYLEAADKPQPMIALEAKFIETARDPSRELGIDWTGTLETGNFRQVDQVTEETDATTGQKTVTVDFNNVATNGGYRADLANLFTTANLGAAGGALGWPALGILSGQDLNVKLRALLRDEETKMSSYPRMVTLNNREVSFRSVVNQPVLDATASASLGTGSTTTQSVTYLPIGTILNILPRRMDGDKILLNMSITVSSIVGNAVIGGNPYPVASTRNYSAPVEMESGYTVAVGGLDEAKEREGKAGVPFLHSIPGLGKLFKYDSKSKNHKNLMLFITPNIIDPRNGGLPDQPQSVVPQKPGNLPKIPRVDPNSGALIGGPAALPNAVSFLERETDILYHIINEGRITPEEPKKVKELKIAVEQLHAQCDIMKQQYPGDLALIEAHQQQLQDLIIRNHNIGKLLLSKKYR
ncbi:MAG: hypothetical protein U0984_17305 [Prosthecobacter sp.]|nr:hypothetical protein [Prosthecobacter sp.]